MASATAAGSSSSAPDISSHDKLYSFDAAALEQLQKNKPWMADPKFFKTVMISPSCAAKMLMHAQSGVEKGIAAPQGKPIEVMGLMIGRPDPENATRLIVCDAYPIDADGFETQVATDDDRVMRQMIDVSEQLEHTRHEKIMGWYHSHPFDVGVNSHCFMSTTDIQTQLTWQRSEDPAGNPFLAIVIDPLRSIAKNVPVFGAFRVYPPDFSPPANECPDGCIVTDEQRRTELWGSGWNRYYALKIEYFMSSLGASAISLLAEKVLWMRTLGSTPMIESESRDRVAERIANVADSIRVADVQFGTGSVSRVGMGHHVADRPRGGAGAGAGGRGGAGGDSKDDSALAKAVRESAALAAEHGVGQTTQVVKGLLFTAGVSVSGATGDNAMSDE